MNKSIAIDMDDTVADTVSRYLEWYNLEFNTQLTKDDIAGYKIYNYIPKDHYRTVRSYPQREEFFQDLPLIDNAVETIKALSEHYDIYFASAAMEYPASFTAKYQWLQKHFPFISDMNYIFCGHKHMLNCDILIDDSPRHIDKFPGKGLLFDSEHNRQIEGYDKVYDWLEIRSRLLPS